MKFIAYKPYLIKQGLICIKMVAGNCDFSFCKGIFFQRNRRFGKLGRK